MGVVKQSVSTLEGCGTNTGIKAFIFDDTTIQKIGYKIEGVSKVWNHVINRSVLGYQLLVMGYYDGTMFISIKNRMENYESLGKLFENTKAECLELKLHDRLLALLIAIAEIIDLLLGDVDSQEIISKVINNPEAFEKLKLIINPQKFVLKNVA